MKPVRAGLLTASVLFAACAVETGEVLVNVGCASGACAEGGDVFVAVTDCDEEFGVYGEAVRALAGSGATVSVAFDNVLDGTRCVQAFLDLDTNGALSAGDVIPSAALALDDDGDGDPDADDEDLEPENEIPVEVTEDETTVLDVVLDTVLP